MKDLELKPYSSMYRISGSNMSSTEPLVRLRYLKKKGQQETLRCHWHPWTKYVIYHILEHYLVIA